MKPCENNKRLLALMAAGVPDGTNAERLRQHMESCSGCRRYWESMCVLSERLVNISELPQAKPSEDFHATLAARIATQEQRRPGLEWLINIRQLWRERPLAAFSTGAALVFATLLCIQSFSPNEHRMPPAAKTAVISEAPQPVVASPTLASYRRAAEISGESFDALLNEQITRTSPANQKFTVSSLLTSSSEY